MDKIIYSLLKLLDDNMYSYAKSDIMFQFGTKVALPILTKLAEHPHNIEEVGLLRNKMLQIVDLALSMETLKPYQHTEQRSAIFMLFKPYYYKDTLDDHILKGFHFLENAYSKESYNFDNNTLPPMYVRETIQFMLKLLESLRGEGFKSVIMRKILNYDLGQTNGYGDISKFADRNYVECCTIAQLLGWFEPGTASQVAFFTQCKSLDGLKKIGKYDDDDYRSTVTSDDLRLTQEFLDKE